MVSFLCNICGRSNSIPVLKPEESSCDGCGSNIRLRALIYLLSCEMFGEGIPLPEFPPMPGIHGLGLSDQASYAVRLSEKLSYTNTFYDREPRLDITARNEDRYGTYDFILSSEVFEHVAVPVERAFEEAYSLLKPHGVLCATVPFSLDASTVERFPDLHEFALAALGGSPVLINRTPGGTLQIRDDLVFHGGAGQTLEMRLFSQKDLVNNLHRAGFRDVSFQSAAIPEFGIAFEGQWSLPLVARKQPFVFATPAVRYLVSEYCTRAKELAESRERYAGAMSKLEECGLRSARIEAECGRHIARLEAELAERGAWAKGLEQELQKANQLVGRLQTEFEERTEWALRLNEDLELQKLAAERLQAQVKAATGSRWVKLGNKFGLGPKLAPPKGG